MPSYISSNNNRFYAATESSYGVAPAIQSHHRIPAVKLKITQQKEHAERKDKTGSRTFLGTPAGVRRQTAFSLGSYMTAWVDQTREPAHGALFSAAMGGAAQMYAGGTVAASNGTTLGTTAPHGLSVRQGVSVGNEIRFVDRVIDTSTVQLNAPFANAVTAGMAVNQTATYTLASSLNSASVFDYWSPGTATQRMIAGASLDKMQIKVNGDYHEFEFSGGAADVVDNSSFVSGQAGLTQYPAEPAIAGFDYTIIPGHLGQAWIGSVPNQFFTLTSAEIRLQNGLQLREREFGSIQPRAIVPGLRTVLADFSVFAQDDAGTQALYQAARQMSPVSVMLQLGNQAKELFAVHLRNVLPEVPEFDDTETRLQWTFKNSRAQGISDDEITVAFA